MTTMHRARPRSWFGALTLALSAVLAGSGPAIAVTSPEPSLDAAPVQVTVPINPASIAQVHVEGLLRTGEPFTASGFGVVVDTTGLVLAPAVLVAPDAPGVAVRYADWNLPASVSTITVELSPGAGQPATSSFTGQVLAVDGYLDVAIVGLDAASASFTAVGLSTATHAVGDDVVVIDAGSLVRGGMIDPVAFSATVTELGSTARIPTDPAWLTTDLVPPDSLWAGELLITDSAGMLAAVSTYSPFYSSPAVAWGWLPSLVQPLLDAVRQGVAYSSMLVVPGSGDEAYTPQGWSAEAQPCGIQDPPIVTDYPEGTGTITALFAATGLTAGEDIVNVWWDPVARTLDAVGQFQWQGESPDGCVSAGLNGAEGTALPNREYALTVFVGGTLRQVAFERTEIKAEVPAGAIVVEGRIVDADTGQPIESAFIVILKQGVDLGTWFDNPDDTQVAASAITGADGTYATDPPIAPDVYPFLIQAFGYQPVGGNLDITAGGFLPDIALTSVE